ncbi:MAG: ECF transporter S component [Ruminococcus sp.]|nr:ECF transporter S component [Ruminococcus sp.]
MKNINKKLVNMLLSAMFLSIGLLLPFLTGQIQQIGNMLLPMHLPVILCSLVCGWQYGLAIGVILPIMRSLVFTMPVLYPSAITMSFELATYGFLTGFLFVKARWQCIRSLYRCLITSMLAGRAVWGIAMLLLLGFKGEAFTLSTFISGAFINAVPGIILQLIIVPGVMLTLDRTHLRPFRKASGSKESAYE